MEAKMKITENEEQSRILKIQPQLRENRWNKVLIPEIKLSGIWLNDLGFTPARHVTVIAKHKVIIIKLLE